VNRKIFNYFEIAASMARSKEDGRSFLLGAIGIRSDGVMVKALNSISEVPNRRCHAEYRLASRLDYGATIYVARVKLIDQTFGMSKPCKNCQKMLASRKVKKVYYTISQNEYGIWYPE